MYKFLNVKIFLLNKYIYMYIIYYLFNKSKMYKFTGIYFFVRCELKNSDI